MDILEFIKPDSTFTPSQIIQEKITFIIEELYQYKLLNTDSEDEQKIVEGWRHQLWAIRIAVANVLDK